MTAGTAEQNNDGKTLQPPARAGGSTRKPAAGEAGPLAVARFFLAKTESNGSGPVLDREFATEAEALIESLKTGRSYYSVIEWRAIADCTGKAPQIKKEPAPSARKGVG